MPSRPFVRKGPDTRAANLRKPGVPKLALPRISLHRIRALVTAIIMLSLIGGIMYAVLKGFNVQNIEFVAQGMRIEYNERLIAGNMFFFPSANVRRDLLAAYPQLKDVEITKKFPHTILIRPVLRTPFAILTTANASYILDEDGAVLGVATPDSRFPELFIDVPVVRVGGRIQDANVKRSLEFLSQGKMLFPASSIRTIDNGSTLKAVSDKTELLFTRNQRIDSLMATLQTIVTGVRIKGTMPKVIDVRFSKPVIQW